MRAHDWAGRAVPLLRSIKSVQPFQGAKYATLPGCNVRNRFLESGGLLQVLSRGFQPRCGEVSNPLAGVQNARPRCATSQRSLRRGFNPAGLSVPPNGLRHRPRRGYLRQGGTLTLLGSRQKSKPGKCSTTSMRTRYHPRASCVGQLLNGYWIGCLMGHTSSALYI
jgi:hypothetical protein